MRRILESTPYAPIAKAALLAMVSALFVACSDDGKERVPNFNLSAAALNDYRETYYSDAHNKAFAISPDGAYAAAHSFPSIDLATATALLKCNLRVQPGQLECLIFDINGVVIGKAPVRLRRL